MIGQSTINNAARTRMGNVKTAVKHYLRKDAGRNTMVGGIGSVGVTASYFKRNGIPLKGNLSHLGFYGGLGAIITNIGSGGYRLLRTAIRNPNSSATQTQMQKWERDLAEAPSFRSQLSKLAFWKKK